MKPQTYLRCCGDSRVKDVLVSHRGEREDDLLLRRHGSTTTTSPWQPVRDDKWPQLQGLSETREECDITKGGGVKVTSAMKY